MSIVIRQQPQKYTPAYNDMVYIVTSNNTAQDNFKYVCDVYVPSVSSVAGNHVARMAAPAHPTVGSGRFDISGIVRQYVDSDISKSGYGFQTCPNSYEKYFVTFGEQYGPSSGVTVYANLSTGTTKYAYNACLDFKRFQNYSYPNFILGSSTGTYLTDSPSTGVIREDVDYWAHMIQDVNSDVNDIEIKTYDSANTLLQTVTINNSHTTPSTNDDHRFLRINIGTNGLNNASLGSGVQPVIAASVVKYSFQTRSSIGGYTSEKRWFKINRDCTDHTEYHIHFLNEKGGFDSFTFIRASRTKSTITRSMFKKRYGTQGQYTWSYNKSDRSDVQFATVIKDKITVNSDWIDDNQSEWLRQLVESPEVYYDDGTDMFAITVLNAEFETKKAITDRLFNMVLEFEYSYHRYRQTW